MKFSVLLLVGFALSVGCVGRSRYMWGDLARANELVFVDPDSAAVVLGEIRLKNLHDKRSLAGYNFLRTIVDDRLGRHHESVVGILSARDVFAATGASDSLLAVAELYTGRVYEDIDEREKAIESYYEAQKLAEKVPGNDFWKGRIAYNIGYMHHRGLDYDNATASINDAIAHFRLSGHKSDLAYSYHLSGINYSFCDRDDEALASFSASDSLYRELGLTGYLLQNAISRARIYLKSNDVNSADSTLRSTWDEFCGGTAPLNHLPLISRIENAKGNHLRAVEMLEEYLSRADGVSLIDQKSYRYLISTYLSEAGLHREAYRNLDRFVALSDSLCSDQVVAVLHQAEKRFEKRELEAEYGSYRKAARYRIVSFSVFAAAIIVALGSLLHIRKRKNVDLQADLNGIEGALSRVIDEKSEKEARLQDVLTNKMLHLQRMADNLFLYENRPEDFRHRVTTTIREEREHYLDELHEVVNEKFGGLVDHLRTRFPDLSEDEISICCLICFGFNNNQIGILFGYTNPNSIFNKRHKLRRKMGLWPNYESLEAYLAQLVAELKESQRVR